MILISPTGLAMIVVNADVEPVCPLRVTSLSCQRVTRRTSNAIRRHRTCVGEMVSSAGPSSDGTGVLKTRQADREPPSLGAAGLSGRACLVSMSASRRHTVTAKDAGRSNEIQTQRCQD